MRFGFLLRSVVIYYQGSASVQSYSEGCRLAVMNLRIGLGKELIVELVLRRRKELCNAPIVAEQPAPKSTSRVIHLSGYLVRNKHPPRQAVEYRQAPTVLLQIDEG